VKKKHKRQLESILEQVSLAFRQNPTNPFNLLGQFAASRWDEDTMLHRIQVMTEQITRPQMSMISAGGLVVSRAKQDMLMVSFGTYVVSILDEED